MKHLSTLPAVRTIVLCLFVALPVLSRASATPVINPDQVFTISEDEVPGANSWTIAASGFDGTLHEFLLADGDGAPVDLDKSTGIFSLTGSLDFENVASYSINVAIVDIADETTVLSTETIILQVADVDEMPQADGVIISNITYEGADFSVNVFTNGLSTTAAIQLSTNSVLSDIDPETLPLKASIDGSKASETVLAEPRGLLDGTVYYYRVVAKNSAGTYYGPTQSFTTLSLPEVENILAVDPNPTRADEVNFSLLFSEDVSGVDLSDLTIQTTGTVAADLSSITQVSASEYTVLLTNVNGDGTLKINLTDDNSIESVATGYALGGPAVGDGDFTDGETYTIDNTSPTITPTVKTNEDASVTFSFEIGDDPGGPGDLTVSVSSSNTTLVPEVEGVNYTVVQNGNEVEVTINPAENRHGETTITITITDPVELADDIAYKVIVRAVADAPLITVANASGDEDTAIPLSLNAALRDTDGSEILSAIRLSNLPSGATLNKGISLGSGVYSFADASELSGLTITPPLNYNGAFDLTLSATAQEQDNLDEATASETFTVMVNPVNDFPTFTLSESLIEDDEDFTSTYTITVNPDAVPADETGQEVKYSLDPASTSVANISIDENTGQVTITAKPDANGNATIKVIADDQQAENNLAEQSFDLIVNPVNDAPAFTLSTETVVRDEDFTDVASVTVSPADVPSDEAGQTVTYSLDPASVAFANLSIDPATGEVSITAMPDMFGSEEITVLANDGQAVNNTYTQSFTLTVNPVNDVPAFTLTESNIVRDEDFSDVVTINVVPTAVPFGEGSQPVTYSLDPAGTDVANLSIDETTGQVTITALPDANGTVSIKVIADDQQAENNLYEQSFTLTVNPVNDAPEFSLSESLIIKEEDFEETVTLTASLQDVPEDEASQAVTYSLSPASVSFANVTIDEATGEITITSIADQFGEQEFTVTANDGQAVNNSTTQTFTLRINPVNDAPAFSLSANEVVRDEDFTDVVTLTVNEEARPFGEADQDPVFSLEPASTGIANMVIDPATGEITITAIADAFGELTVTVIADDQQAENNLYTQTFTLIINPVNDLPVFSLNPDAVSLQEDFEGVVNVTAEMGDSPANEAGEEITFSLRDVPAELINASIDPVTGEISLTAVTDANGSGSLTVVANDGDEYTQTLIIEVSPVNDAPAFTVNPETLTLAEDFDGVQTVQMQAAAVPADEADQDVAYSLSPANPTIADVSIDPATGELSITAIADQYGEQQFTITANDGQAANATYSQEFRLIVEAVNDAPAFTLSADYIQKEEDFEGEVNITVSPAEAAFGEESEVYAYSLLRTSGTANLATVAIDEATGRVRITAVPNAFGEAVYEVTATDGASENATFSQSFTLKITPVNDAPTGEDVVLTFTEDVEGSFDFSMFNDIDDASLEPTFSEPLPEWISFEQGDNFVWTVSGMPANEDVGTFVTSVTANDAAGLTAGPYSLTIIVEAVNDLPEIIGLPAETSLMEHETVTVNFSVQDEETPTEELEVSLSANGSLDPASFSLVTEDASAGLYQIVIDPVGFVSGSSTLTVLLSDGEHEVSAAMEVVVTELFADPTNLFTPNGDGRNDRWEIPGLLGYASSAMRIYNENGQLLYDTDNYVANPWDGTYNGNEMPEGAYVFLLTVINEPGTAPVEFKGIIHLAR